MGNLEYEEATNQFLGMGPYHDEAYKDIVAYRSDVENAKKYFSIVARLSLEAARDSDVVVMSHATSSQKNRLFFRQVLTDAGAKDVSSVFLYCDPDAHAEVLYKRSLRQAEQAHSDPQVIFHFLGAERPLEDVTAFKQWFKNESLVYNGFQEASEAEQPYSVVDNTAKDVTVLDSLDEALGLDKNESRGDGTYEEMIEKIRAVDIARDQVAMQAFHEILERDNSESAEATKELAKNEPKKLAARRAAVITAHKVESARGLKKDAPGKLKSVLAGSLAATFIKSGTIAEE